MAVHDVGDPADRTDVLQRMVGHGVKVGPEHLLAEVPSGAEGQAHNPCSGCNLFGLMAIFGIDLRVDILRVRSSTWPTSGRAASVRASSTTYGLSTGVRVAPQFQIMASNEAVHAYQNDIQTLSLPDGSHSFQRSRNRLYSCRSSVTAPRMPQMAPAKSIARLSV